MIFIFLLREPIVNSHETKVLREKFLRNSLNDLRDKGNILHKKTSTIWQQNFILTFVWEEKRRRNQCENGTLRLNNYDLRFHFPYTWLSIMILSLLKNFYVLYYLLRGAMILYYFTVYLRWEQGLMEVSCWSNNSDWCRDDQCRKTWDYQFSRFDIRRQLRYLIRTQVVWTFEKRRWLDQRIKASPRIHFIESELF